MACFKLMFGTCLLRRVKTLWLALLVCASLSPALAQTAKVKPKATSSKPVATAKKTATSAKTKTTATKKPGVSAKKPVTAAKKAPARKPVSSAKKTTAAKKRVTSAKRAPVRRTTRRRAAVAARPRVPLQPSADRLKEIQGALAREGYLQDEPTGKWDDTSIAAMKRFQAEHSIPSTGKINSLSLIALGLGPVRGPAPGSESVLQPAADGSTPASTSSSADR